MVLRWFFDGSLIDAVDVAYSVDMYFYRRRCYLGVSVDRVVIDEIKFGGVYLQKILNFYLFLKN